MGKELSDFTMGMIMGAENNNQKSMNVFGYDGTSPLTSETHCDDRICPAVAQITETFNTGHYPPVSTPTMTSQCRNKIEFHRKHHETTWNCIEHPGTHFF